MKTFVEELVDREGTNDMIEKIVRYNDLRRLIEGSNPWAVCYDMKLYVELYKNATSSGRRAYAKKLIDDTIVDDFIGADGIIDNFELFIEMKDFLHEDDVNWFDSQCMSVLDYLSNRVNRSKRPEKPQDVPLDSKVQEKYLRRAVEAVKSTEMTEMRSYNFALKILA
ncbi:hypothetical protein J6V86_01380 [bacterium]|nr:hypothetical protein [bacterium]